MEKAKYRGLSSQEVAQKLAQFGPNEIREKKKSPLAKVARRLVSPISLMLLAAALLSLYVGKIFDFYFILFLMLINLSVEAWQEHKADDAIEKLGRKLAVKAKVLRGENWEWIEAREIVPGDIIDLNMGDIVPADVSILEAKNLSINEAALTGESLPKEKGAGDEGFSGSFVTLGWARCRVKATGTHTYFGRILISIDKTQRRSLLERDILSISKWLSAVALASAVLLTVMFLWLGKPWAEIMTLDLSLVIAGIPISLPTVMTLIISFGVLDLAKKRTIVRRLSALEDLADVELLLTDKTGTLTRNEITVEKIVAYGGFSEDEVLAYASFTTRANDHNPINLAVRKKAESLRIETEHETIDYIPFDSVRKRSTAIVEYGGEELSVRTGASQIIEPFCAPAKDLKEKFEADVAEAAGKGYRVVAVAVKNHSKKEGKMRLAGLLLFSDTLERGAKGTIGFIRKSGIGIKMLSGDNAAIADMIAKELSLSGRTVNKSVLGGKDFKELDEAEFDSIGAFAEILPDDKLEIVKLAQKKYSVAVTGDGVNDLPALKAADVGIAVRNAVDALKSAADLVLTGSGISVIRDAIVESRRIFSRLYAYSVYRISESFRVIITIAALGLAYGTYPLQPLQLILLALLNDIPIISLAFNRVKLERKPSRIDSKARLASSALFGLVGVANSLLLVLIMETV